MSDVVKKLDQLKTLIDLSALINSTLDIGEVKKQAMEAAVKLLDAEAGSLLLIEKESGDLFFEVALGDKADQIKTICLSKGQGICGWVAEKGEPVSVPIDK